MEFANITLKKRHIVSIITAVFIIGIAGGTYLADKTWEQKYEKYSGVYSRIEQPLIDFRLSVFAKNKKDDDIRLIVFDHNNLRQSDISKKINTVLKRIKGAKTVLVPSSILRRGNKATKQLIAQNKNIIAGAFNVKQKKKDNKKNNDTIVPPSKVTEAKTKYSNIGHTRLKSDYNGILRSFNPVIEYSEGGRRILPLGVVGGLQAKGKEVEDKKIIQYSSYVQIGSITMPLDYKNKTLFISKKSASDYLYTTINPKTIDATYPFQEKYKGKNFVLGVAGHNIQTYTTPAASSLYNFELQALLLEMVKEHNFIAPVRTWTTLMLLVLFTFPLILAPAFLSVTGGLLFLFTSFFALLFGSFVLFKFGVLINISTPLIVGVGGFIIIMAQVLAFERNKRKEIKTTFESYMSSSVLNEVMDNSSNLNFDGKRKKITILFADIANFTKFSEGRRAAEVANALKEIMTELTQRIFKYDGVVDKYVGDEIMAEFGIVHGEPPEHEKRAVNASLDMLKHIKKKHKNKWKRGDWSKLNLRIGLHTGYATIGNMGSKMVFDYTAIGDTVNTASRLQQANKYYGTNMLVSKPTYAKTKKSIVARKIDYVTVPGKSKPVRIYEVFGRKNAISNQLINLCDQFDQALLHYYRRDWSKAINVFEKILKTVDDKPSRIFRNRARRFRADPPSNDWNGVYDITNLT